MKKIILILLMQLALRSFSQVNFIGFDRNVCVQSMNNNYTYSNFSSGSGSGTTYGYTIYKNNVAVYSSSGQMANSKICNDLKFINDSIGFLVYYSGNTGNRVLRTHDYGQTWSDIGGGAPNYFGLYVVNSNFAYLVTEWYSPEQLYISKCSSFASYVNSSFIFDQTLTLDVFKSDTILNSDLCNIDSLKIFVKNGVDTICYHINFMSLNTGIHPEIFRDSRNYFPYPNPSIDFFTLRSSSYELDSVCLISINGNNIVNYDKQSIFNNHFSLDGVSNGIYIVKVSEKDHITYRKILVNNYH